MAAAGLSCHCLSPVRWRGLFRQVPYHRGTSPWHVPMSHPRIVIRLTSPCRARLLIPVVSNRIGTAPTTQSPRFHGPARASKKPTPTRLEPCASLSSQAAARRRRQPRSRRRWQLQSGTDDSDGTGSARTAGPDTANPAAHGGGPRLSGSEGEPGPAGREKETRRASQARWAGPYRPLARWPERPGRPGSSWPGLGRAGPGRPGGPAGQRGCGGGALEVYLPGFFRKYRSTASCARPPHLPTHPPTYPHTRHHVPRPGFPPSSVSLFARAASSPRPAGRKTMLPAPTFFCPR